MKYRILPHQLWFWHQELEPDSAQNLDLEGYQRWSTRLLLHSEQK